MSRWGDEVADEVDATADPSDPVKQTCLDTTALDSIIKNAQTLPEPLQEQLNTAIRQTFGRDIDYQELVRRAQAVTSGGAVTPEEVVELALMYAYFLENSLGNPGQADLLRFYLNRTAPSPFKPKYLTFDLATRTCFLPASTVLDVANFELAQTNELFPRIKQGVTSRLRTPNVLRPGTQQHFEKPDGTTETLEPKPSPLHAGGTELIYAEYNVRIPGDEIGVVQQSLGTIKVYSKVSVTTTPVEAGRSWNVSYSQIENWGFDDGNFLSGNNELGEKYETQDLEIKLGDFINAPLEAARYLYPELRDLLPSGETCFRLTISDKLMAEIAEMDITLKDGQKFRPSPFRIWIEPWPTTATSYPDDFSYVIDLGPPN